MAKVPSPTTEQIVERYLGVELPNGVQFSTPARPSTLLNNSTDQPNPVELLRRSLDTYLYDPLVATLTTSNGELHSIRFKETGELSRQVTCLGGERDGSLVRWDGSWHFFEPGCRNFSTTGPMVDQTKLMIVRAALGGIEAVDATFAKEHHTEIDRLAAEIAAAEKPE